MYGKFFESSERRLLFDCRDVKKQKERVSVYPYESQALLLFMFTTDSNNDKHNKNLMKYTRKKSRQKILISGVLTLKIKIFSAYVKLLKDTACHIFLQRLHFNLQNKIN